MQTSENRNLLTICIPTYNRCRFLDYGVRKLAPEAEKYGIEIIIVDNASPDETEKIGRGLSEEYSFIHYYRNDTNIGPDRNFEKALKLSTSRYAWLMSDDDGIDFSKIPEILHQLDQNDLDLFVLNAENRVVDVPSKLYTNHSKLLSEIGWHMQMMSCLIFSRELIHNADFDKFQHTFLVQYGIIFDTIGKKKDIQVFFFSDIVIVPFYPNDFERKQGDGWMQNALPIFVENWSRMILNFPECYSMEAKRMAIRDHGEKSGLFRFQSLLRLSLIGALTASKLHEVRKYYGYAIAYPYWLVNIISRLPANNYIYQALRTIKHSVKILLGKR